MPIFLGCTDSAARTCYALNMKRFAAVAAMAVMAAACGSDGTSPGAGISELFSSGLAPCRNTGDLIVIGDILTTGQPTLNYQPSADIAQVVEQSDVAVRGFIDSAVRSRSYTSFDVSGVEVLAGSADVVVDGFGFEARWVERNEPDPLREPVQFSNLEFVAILNKSAAVPGGYTPAIEGFVLNCEGATGAARSVMVETPPGSTGLPLGEFADLVAGS